MTNFMLQTPSLQHLAQVKIATQLWTRYVCTIGHCFDHPMAVKELKDDAQEWLIIKDVIKSKVWGLPLPERCIKQLVDFISPLGTEIIHWCQYYNEDNDTVQLLDTFLPHQLCWTMRGTIDYAKTAELMVKDERVDLQTRFEIACLSCLEDEARELFGRVAQERKQEYVPILRYVRKEGFSQLILFFTRSINLDVRRPSFAMSNKYLFRHALRSDNRAMCVYVFQTFTNGERNQIFEDCREILEFCSRFPSSFNVIYYLSLMNEEQQRRVFKKHACDVLLCFLHWPMQSLFMEAWKCGWQQLMNECGCSHVLIAITRKIGEGSNVYDYCQLFWECWRSMPAQYAQRCLSYDLLLRGLLFTKREDFIKLILDGSVESRQMKREYGRILCVLMFEGSAICDAALMECKETAALKSSNEPEDEEKRLRSEQVSRLVDNAMRTRIGIRKRLQLQTF